jgi:hypothetical protein
MTRVTFTDIAPDGVRMVVDWEKFVPGSSVFIPCINTGEAMKHVISATGASKSALEKRVCVENGKYGLRVWRMK